MSNEQNKDEDSLDFTVGSKIFAAPDEATVKSILAEENDSGSKETSRVATPSSTISKDEVFSPQVASPVQNDSNGSVTSAVNSSVSSITSEVSSGIGSGFSSIPSTTLTTYVESGIYASNETKPCTPKENPYHNPYHRPTMRAPKVSKTGSAYLSAIATSSDDALSALSTALYSSDNSQTSKTSSFKQSEQTKTSTIKSSQEMSKPFTAKASSKPASLTKTSNSSIEKSQ